MNKLIAGLIASAAILCSLPTPAFANGPDHQQNLVARGAANKGLFGVMHNPHTNDARVSGDLPKMNTGLRALPFYKGLGPSALVGSKATRLGFRFLGRQKETIPVTGANGQVIGQETRVVTRVFNRGSETRTLETPEGSSRTEYKFRQNPVAGTKSWEANATSTERKGNDVTVTTKAVATGGDNHSVGMHSTGTASSTVTRGKGQNAVVLGEANVSARKGWSD